MNKDARQFVSLGCPLIYVHQCVDSEWLGTVIAYPYQRAMPSGFFEIHKPASHAPGPPFGPLPLRVALMNVGTGSQCVWFRAWGWVGVAGVVVGLGPSNRMACV